MKGARRILPGLVLLVGAALLVASVLVSEPEEDGGFRPDATSSFSAPRWLAVDLNGGQASLQWRSVPGALAYTLWRSTASEGSYQVILMGPDTLFADPDSLPPGATYCYQLTATDWELNDSAFSDSRCVTNPR